jgi:hypothetical protein
MKYNLEKIQDIFETEQNITLTAKRYAKEENIEYDDSLRRKFSSLINKSKEVETAIDNDLQTETTTETNQYANDKESEKSYMPSAWDAGNNCFYTIEEYCDKYNLDISTVRSSKLVVHIAGHMVYNIAFSESIFSEEGINEEFVEEVIQKHIKPINLSVNRNLPVNSEYFDRCVMTDIHLNMDPSGEINTVPMYQHKWGSKEIFERLDLAVQHIIDHKKGDVLIIDELGDLMDGLNSQTTRGGHHLPQTTSDKEAFQLGIDFKMYLIDRVVHLYDKVVMNNITNDNHSFLFGFFVNDSVRRIVETKYPDKVEYNVIERFIDHYSVSNHTFIISHGKDSGEKKFGFKATYDPKAADVIDQYCKSHKLYNGNFLEFSMGDQHQRIFDTTSNNDFNYFAYGAFSPPSNWVGTNFKDTSSSFDMFNIHKEKNLKINIPLIF